MDHQLADLQPAKNLVRHYTAITLGGACSLLLLVSTLFYFQYDSLQEASRRQVDQQLRDRASALGSFLESTTFYLNQLRITAESYLDPNNPISVQLEEALQVHQSAEAEAFSLDRLGTMPTASRIGNLFGTGSYEELHNKSPDELQMAYGLFSLFRASHEAFPDMTQSYYQSVQGFTALYPWKSTATILAQFPGLSMAELQETLLKMDLVQRGTTFSNPHALPFWTKIYQDPAGRGLMVSHGVPVRRNFDFLGVIATDVTLASLETYVKDLPQMGGTLLIVNQYQQVLVASHTLPGNESQHELAQVLPLALQPFLDEVNQVQQARLVGDYLVARSPVGKTEWSVLYLLPRMDFVNQNMYAVLGFLILVLGLCVFLVTVYVLLQRRFVRPALALTDHIRAEALEGNSQLPDVPEIWQPWFEAVSDTLALKHVTTNLPGAVFQLRQHSHQGLSLSFISQGIKALIGRDPDQELGLDFAWEDLFLPQDLPAMRAALRESVRTGQHFHFQCQIQNRGQLRWARFSSRPRQSTNGGTVWEGLVLDVTQQKLAEEALQASEQRLRSIMDASLFPLVVSRMSDQRAIFANERALQLFGIKDLSPLNRTIQGFWAEPAQRSDIYARIAMHGRVEQAEVCLRRADNATFWVLMSAIEILYENERCVLFTYMDITRRRELEDELKILATTDALTGTHNRRSFLELGERAWNRARQGHLPFTGVLLDIDYFKRINDSYGHPAGDQVLRLLVAHLQEHLRPMDLLGRMGGEEFGLFLPNTGEHDAMEVAERLRETVASLAIPWGSFEIPITMSLGVAVLNDGDSTLEHLFARADQALYKAKHAGRNRVILADPKLAPPINGHS